jgi:hypothetical protein
VVMTGGQHRGYPVRSFRKLPTIYCHSRTSLLPLLLRGVRRGNSMKDYAFAIVATIGIAPSAHAEWFVKVG